MRHASDVVRPATNSDAQAIASLWIRSRQASIPAIPKPIHSDGEIHRWVSDVLLPGGGTWLIEDDDELIGMMTLRDGWIDQLYVDPGFAGMGLGTQLLDFAKRARPQGLRLWTFVSNAGAQRFYERNGFKEVERTDGSQNEERAPDIQYEFLPT